MRKDDITEVSVSCWFRLESLSALRGVVHIAKTNYSVKRSCYTLKLHFQYFCYNRFYRNGKVPEHSFDSEAVE